MAGERKVIPMVINTRMISENTRYAIIQNMLVIPFQVEHPEKLQAALLPPPLKPLGNGDIGWVYFVDTVLPALRDVPGEPPDPDLTEFAEISIGMPCIAEGKERGIFTQLALDRPTAGLKRGILRHLAYTQLTQTHPMLEGRRSVSPGVQLVGISHRPHGEMVACGTMTVTHSEPWEDVPEYMKTFLHMRYITDPTQGGKPLIADFCDCVFPEPLAGDVAWRGETTLLFGGDCYGRFHEIGPYQALQGYFFTIAYCYGSDEQVALMEGVRPWQWA